MTKDSEIYLLPKPLYLYLPMIVFRSLNLTVLSSIHEFGPVTSKYHLIYFLKFTWLDATVDAIVIGPPRVPLF